MHQRKEDSTPDVVQNQGEKERGKVDGLVIRDGYFHWIWDKDCKGDFSVIIKKKEKKGKMLFFGSSRVEEKRPYMVFSFLKIF